MTSRVIILQDNDDVISTSSDNVREVKNKPTRSGSEHEGDNAKLNAKFPMKNR